MGPAACSRPNISKNKLKFFADVKEAVAFGDGRDFVAVMLNIDLTSVANWAERNNISYGSYQELASHPKIYEMMAAHVDKVNRDLAAEDPGSPSARSAASSSSTRSSTPTTASSRARRRCAGASSPSGMRR